MVRRKLTNSDIGVNVGIPDEDLPVVEEIIEAVIGTVDEPETVTEAPVKETKLEQLQRVTLAQAMVTEDSEADRIKHYVKSLYYIHGDKTEALITGFESLYGLTMLAALSGIPTNNTFPISGQHMHKANQHYKKVLKTA